MVPKSAVALILLSNIFSVNASADEETKIVCVIRSCPNIYYPNSCFDRTERFTFNAAKTIVWAGEDRKYQFDVIQTADSLSWGYSFARYLLDRTTLRLRNDPDFGQCQMDEHQL
jgi:hypothetical protein